MSRSPKCREQIQSVRKDDAREGEPLLVKHVSVCGMGRDGSTPYLSPTSDGAELAGIEIGDDVEVSVFRDGLFIQPSDG